MRLAWDSSIELRRYHFLTKLSNSIIIARYTARAGFLLFGQQPQTRKPYLSGLLRDLKTLSDLLDQVASGGRIERQGCGASVTFGDLVGEHNDAGAWHQQRPADVRCLPLHPVVLGSGHNGVAFAAP